MWDAKAAYVAGWVSTLIMFSGKVLVLLNSLKDKEMKKKMSGFTWLGLVGSDLS